MMKSHLAATLTLLIFVLAGCSTPTPRFPSTVGPAEQEGSSVPTPGVSSTVDLQPFVEMAVQAGCARDQNRLFVIDDAMVLWERRDLGCADASYEISLFGASPDQVLCRNHDSIAGPVLSCEDDSLLPLFQIIVEHINEADLGLDAEHTVEPAWQTG